MTSAERRRFLKMAGAITASSMFSDSIRRALAIGANNRTGTLMDVEHVVILTQENRSFDHYFGTMPGVRGFGDRFAIPLPGGRNVWQQQFRVHPDIAVSRPRLLAFPKPREEPTSDRLVMPYALDSANGNAQRVTGTPHTWDNAQAAWDNGRMHQWPTYKRTWSMGYYTQAELEFQFALADAFTVCDAYHCSFHGGTNPNRLFLWTGTNDPAGAGGGPAIDKKFSNLGPSTEGYTWTTYPERLEAAGIRWKVYQNHPLNYWDNSLEGFRQFRTANEAHGNQPDGSPYPAYAPAHDSGNPLYKGCANTMPDLGMPDALRRDVLDGQLPQVSWVVAPDRYCEHPESSSPVLAAWYIQQILDALTADPEVWSKTVLIINFDENDGFFDHVPPPCAPSRNGDGSIAGKSTLADIGSEYYSGEPFHDRIFGPGPRVPMFVVSPWSRGGWVCSQAFDHTSILQFLERRFGVAEPNISTWRRAFCGDLLSCFDFVSPNDGLPSLPVGSRTTSERINTAQERLPQIPLPAESTQVLPVQLAGTKPSRALPYELHATAAVDEIGNRVRVLFANTGTAGAVFHVYDRLHLDRKPRRYGVEAGKMLDDVWDSSADGGRYDLWVLSHNGWHRHFTGDDSALRRAKAAKPEVRICYDIANGDVCLRMKNTGTASCSLQVTDNAYGRALSSFELAPGGSAESRWSLAASNHWYDFSVRLGDDENGYSRRFAGRMEIGRPSVSDPALAKSV